MVSDMCRQAIIVILEQELQPVLNSKLALICAELLSSFSNCHLPHGKLSHKFGQMFSPQIFKWCANVCLASTIKTDRVHRQLVK